MSGKLNDFFDENPGMQKKFMIVSFVALLLFAIVVIFFNQPAETIKGIKQVTINADENEVKAGQIMTIITTGFGNDFDFLQGETTCDFQIKYAGEQLTLVPIPEEDRQNANGQPTVSFVLVNDINMGNSDSYEMYYDCS